jgi:hypothetical protein
MKKIKKNPAALKSSKRKRNSWRPPLSRGRSAGSRGIFMLAAFSAVAAVVFAAAWLLVKFLSPVFTLPFIQIENVRIEGGGSLDKVEILKKAGIDAQTDLMSVDLSGVSRSLPRKEPYIESARLIRNPVEGSLKIKIKLRTPAALVNSAGSLLAVDRSGLVIGDIEKIDFQDLPVITGLNGGVFPAGSVIPGEKIALALTIIEQAGLSGLDLYAPVSEVNMSDLRHIVAYAGSEAMQIRFGVENIRERVAEAAAIVSYLENRGEKAEYIDLRFPKAIVRPAAANR